MRILKIRDQFIATCACLGFLYVIYSWVYRRLDKLANSKHHSWHYELLLWILRIAGVVFIAGIGYLLSSYRRRLNPLYYGFKFNCITETCKIVDVKKKYTGSTSFDVTACDDDRVIFPMNWFRWSGRGKEEIPKVIGKGRQLLGIVGTRRKDGSIKPIPYIRTEKDSPDGMRWHRYFIALNPPVKKGKRINVHYTQAFKGKAAPFVGMKVKSKMEKLVLRIEFPAKFEPETIILERTRPDSTILNSLRLPYNKTHTEDIKKSPYYQNHCVERVIKNPKIGYHYRMIWDT